MQAYILIVYIYSTFVHADIGWRFEHVGGFLVTPRFHHWRHGIEKEAIDVNFAILFPSFDRMFGTFHPAAGRRPKGYGIRTAVPTGYVARFLYRFRR